MSYRTGFYKGRLGIGLSTTMGMGDGKPRYPLDINGDIRLTGDIMNEEGLSLLGSTANGTFVLTDNNDIVLGNDSYKLGIGTASPQAKLDVVGSAVFKSVDAANTGGIVLMPDDEGTSTNGNSSGRIFFNETQNNINNYGFSIGFNGGADNDILNWKANTFNINRHDNSVDGSTVLTINRTSGNIGIGTTSPSTLLQIKGNGDSNNVQLLIENESYNKGIQFQYKSVTGTTYDFPQAKIWTSEASAYDTKLHFSTAKGSSNSNTVLSTVMTLDEDGNVGIGTTSPSDFLTVRHGASSSSTWRGIALEENDATVRWRLALSGANGSEHCYQYMVNASGTQTVTIHADGNSYFTGGNVGIGTTSPQGTLIVKDNASDPCIRAEYAPVGDSSYPDGVYTQLNRYILECKGNNFHIDSHRQLYLRAFDNNNIYIYPYGGTSYLFSPTIDHSSNYRGDSGTKYCGTLVLGRDYYSPYLRGTRVVPGWSDKRHFEIWTSGGNSSTHFAFRCGGYTSHGQCTASSFSPSSDNRLKQNEKKINNGLQIINKLNPVSYFKSQEFHEPDFDYELDDSGVPITDDIYHIELGFIAQDVKKIPELEHTVIGEETELQEEEIYKKDNSGNFILDENDNRIVESKKMVNKKSQLHLNYNELFVCNIAATQELYKKQKANKEEIDNKINEIDNKITNKTLELNNQINNKTLELNNEINNKTLELNNEINNKTLELDNKTNEIDNEIKEIKNTEDILLKSNKYEKNNTENIIGNISFVNGYTIVNDKKIYNKNISDKLYFNPETGKLNCSNIESTYYGDGSNLQGIVKQFQINDLIEENKKIKQENENNKELINFWTQQAMSLNNKLTNIENELKTIKENLGL